jgi:hypothetical protein
LSKLKNEPETFVRILVGGVVDMLAYLVETLLGMIAGVVVAVRIVDFHVRMVDFQVQMGIVSDSVAEHTVDKLVVERMVYYLSEGIVHQGEGIVYYWVEGIGSFDYWIRTVVAYLLKFEYI